MPDCTGYSHRFNRVQAYILAKPRFLLQPWTTKKRGIELLQIDFGRQFLRGFTTTSTGRRKNGITPLALCTDSGKVTPEQAAPIQMKVVFSFQSFVLLTLLAFPAFSEDDEKGFVSIFNGKDLTGWEGIAEAWKVEKGAIVCTGRNEKVKNWLIWKGDQPSDFILRLEFKFTSGNSGVQIRSHLVKDKPPFHVQGYQVEIALAKVMGLWHHSLSPEKYRSHLAVAGEHSTYQPDGKKSVQSIGDGEKLKAHCKDGDWNKLEIIAQGSVLTQKINGHTFSILTDRDEKYRMKNGLIALQDHGKGTVAAFRNIRLKLLPEEK